MDGEKLSYNGINLKEDVQWVFMESSNGVFDTESIESTSNEVSMSSSVESDIEEDDDATSSSSSTSTPGPLYELSQLMDHLPIKRGLSNYFQGKSQSFTSLGSAKSLEDLAKKQSPGRKRVKTSHKRYSPKAIITKKYCSRSPQGSFLSSVRNRGTYTGTSSGKPSISLEQKHFNL